MVKKDLHTKCAISINEDLSEWLHMVDVYIAGYVQSWSKPTLSTIEKYFDEELNWLETNLKFMSVKQQAMALRKRDHVMNLINAKHKTIDAKEQRYNGYVPRKKKQQYDIHDDEMEVYLTTLNKAEKQSVDKYYNEYINLINSSDATAATKSFYLSRLDEIYKTRLEFPF